MSEDIKRFCSPYADAPYYYGFKFPDEQMWRLMDIIAAKAGIDRRTWLLRERAIFERDTGIPDTYARGSDLCIHACKRLGIDYQAIAHSPKRNAAGLRLVYSSDEPQEARP